MPLDIGDLRQYPPDALEALLGKIEAREVRDSFRLFVERAWRVLHPRKQFSGNWHIDCLCAHSEALYRRQIKRLAISIPRRHTKSTVESVCFPAWCWLQDAGETFMFSSYSHGLSIRDSIACRRLIRSSWYQAVRAELAASQVIPDWSLAGDQDTQIRYDNTSGGFRYATSTGGTVLGGGASILCLPYASKIETDQGCLPIGRIVEERLPVRVLGYSGWQEIEEFIVRGGPVKMVRLTSKCGSVLDCSEEHPVWVEGRGFVSAVDLVNCAYEAQPVLRRLRGDVLPKSRSCFGWWAPSGMDAPARLQSAERYTTEDAVYNLQVGPDHTYYANGFLTHNCGDDLNDINTIHSEGERKKAERWFRQIWLGSLDDPKTGVILNIQQRGHADDVTGYLERERPDFEFLRIPAEYRRKYHTVTSIWQDPRTTDGELLWPARFDRAYVDQQRKDLGSYMASAQLDQRPEPESGGIFERSWFRFYAPSERPEKWDACCTYCDMNFGNSKKKTVDGSFVVYQTWGRVGASWWFIDQARGRWEYAESKRRLKIYATETHPEIWANYVEDKANGPAILSDLGKAIPGIIADTPKGDKVARARAQAPKVEAGQVWLPDPENPAWPPALRQQVRDFLDEIAVFPMGSSDDQVDSFSGALNRLPATALFGVTVQEEPEQVGAGGARNFRGRWQRTGTEED